MFLSEPTVFLRVFGKRGYYPDFSVVTESHAFHSSPDLVWSAVVQPPLPEGWDRAEVYTFCPEEVRLFSALLLAEADPFKNGKCSIQLHAAKQVPVDQASSFINSRELRAIAQSLISSGSQSAAEEPYFRHARGSEQEALQLLQKIDGEDQLLLAGLARFLSGNRLIVEGGFLEEAFIQETISLGAALEFLRQCLEYRDGTNRSFKDVHDYLRDLFTFGEHFTEYLEWMYELRIIATHPSSRFGESWAPPVMVEMVYELDGWLRVLYRHLILGEVPELGG